MLSIGNAFCKIAIAPERGAIVTSLQVQGQEALYLDGATLGDPGKNVRGGIPVLFPICGPLAAADYEVEERRYALKQHGFARNLPWRVLEQQSGRVSLELLPSEHTRAHYPFEFRYELDYSAQAEGLLIEQRSLERRFTAPW